MEQLVANANLIYKNSDVALEMKKRCVTKWEGFKETEDASGMLRQIRTADGKLVHPICPFFGTFASPLSLSADTQIHKMLGHFCHKHERASLSHRK